jgi:hypothetical protein
MIVQRACYPMQRSVAATEDKSDYDFSSTCVQEDSLIWHL